MIEAEAVDIISSSAYLYLYLKFSVKQITMFMLKTFFGIENRSQKKQKRKWMNFKKICAEKNKTALI